MTRFVFALAIATLPLAAQTSSLQGVVTDAQGGALAQPAGAHQEPLPDRRGFSEYGI